MIRLNLPSFDIKVSGSKQHPQILDVLRRKFITPKRRGKCGEVADVSC